MNKLSIAERAQVVRALVEGNSLRSVHRMTGIAVTTILRLLEDVGHRATVFHDQRVRLVQSKRVQCDEIWQYVYCKEKTLPTAMAAQGKGAGSAWTFTALDQDSKLIISWHIGKRDVVRAMAFLDDVRDRLANRVQLTTDGHQMYFAAVANAFGEDVDYAQLVKMFGAARDDEARYSPPTCIGARKERVIGNPEFRYVSTSHVERNNLTMRMGMRRYTRLTNAFSKKLTNLRHAVALHFVYYNFCRVHQTLKKTPAQAAGLANHQLSIEELLLSLDSLTI